MKSSRDSFVYVCLGLLAVFIVANAAVVYRNTHQLNEDAAWVAHTHEVLDALEKVASTAKDAERGHRGYLLTGDAAYLLPYGDANRSLPQTITHVRELTSDNPDQQNRIDILHSQASARLALLGESMAAFEQEGLGGAQRQISTGKDREAMARLLSLLDEMQITEQQLLAIRAEASKRAYRTAIQAGAVAALLGLAGVALFAGLFWRHLKLMTESATRIHEQREFLQATLISIGDAAMATDADGRLTFLNPVAEELTGWSKEDARGRALSEIFHIVNEKTRRPADNPAERALREGKIVGLANHTVLIAKDGTERPIDDSAAPIRDEAGKVFGCILVFRDVSETKAAERMIRSQNARREAILEAALDCIITMDHQGCIVELNPAAERTFGFRRDEVLGKPVAELIVPERLRENHRRGLAAYLQTGEGPVLGKRLELPAIRANGEEFLIEIAITRVDLPGQPLFTACLRDITDRKTAEQTVLRQREQLRVTLASIGDAVIATNADGRVTFMNPVAENLTGWTYEQGAGVPLTEVFNIVNESSREPVENPAVRALVEGIVVGLANHTLLIDKCGFERPIDDSAAPIRNADGTIEGAVLVFRDITARKQVETATAERMKLLALSANVGLALTQGNMLPVSLQLCAEALVQELGGAFARIWTLDAGEDVLQLQASAGMYTHIDGAHARIRVGEFKIGLIAAERKPHLTNQVIGDARIPQQEWVVREGMQAFAGYPLVVDDRLVGVMAMFARHPLSQQTLDAMSSVANEIALGIDRHRANESLAHLLVRESSRSKRLRQVAAASLTLNSASGPASVLGVIHAEAKRIIGANQATVYLQDDSEPSRENGLSAQLLVRGGKRVGEIHLAEKLEGAFTDDDKAILDQLASIAAVALDNARLSEELRENDRRKDEFMAMLAHELRNPLAPIRSAVELITADADTETIEWARGIMKRQVDHIVHLVDDLLDVSRVMQGKIQLRRGSVELSSAIHHAVEEVRESITSHQQSLTLSLPEEPIWVNADAMRLSQVFANLLTNAGKFTDNGGKISVAAKASDGEVTITVADTGSGIAPHMLLQIFEPFTQITSSLDRSRGGLGIGLALVRNLIAMHGGRVRAESDGLGQGSRFVITLPTIAQHFSEPADAPAHVVIAARKVLVVDDNQGAAQSLALLLEKLWGHKVEIAYDGSAAVEAAQRFMPDAVLLDIGLPGISGYEVARQLRQLPEFGKLFLIALTGYGQEQDQKKSKEAGFDLHLVKPVDVPTLQAAFASRGK